jgi:hypothetical protein
MGIFPIEPALFVKDVMAGDASSEVVGEFFEANNAFLGVGIGGVVVGRGVGWMIVVHFGMLV